MTLERAKYKSHSRQLGPERIDQLLASYFAEHEYISCVDCTAGHCNVTCKYPNPSICTRFPSRKYSAVTSLKEISTAATSAGRDRTSTMDTFGQIIRIDRARCAIRA